MGYNIFDMKYSIGIKSTEGFPKKRTVKSPKTMGVFSGKALSTHKKIKTISKKLSGRGKKKTGKYSKKKKKVMAATPP